MIQRRTLINRRHLPLQGNDSLSTHYTVGVDAPIKSTLRIQCLSTVSDIVGLVTSTHLVIGHAPSYGAADLKWFVGTQNSDSFTKAAVVVTD